MNVGSDRLTADKIFINVGVRAVVPDISGLGTARLLTNSSIMSIDTLPQHLVIIGSSYVGLEFGQMFRRFGSEVIILERGPRLISQEDEDVSQAFLEILTREDVRVELNVNAINLASINIAQYGGSHVLVATGRRPNTDDLGLDSAEVDVDARGYIIVDDQLQTSVPGIWALGDCNGRAAFTHTAYNDFEIVAGNLLDGEDRRVSDRIPTYVLFIDSPLGRAGMTEADVRKTGRRALIAKWPMTSVGRAVEKGETQGFMTVLVDAESKHILGASILGTGGDEVIHSILDIMYAKQPYSVIKRAVHIHPTVSELVPTMLGELRPL